ncbi:hypothetical protein EV426DRAFT_342567 [Tirmania nivea]|nr:hypothetical protein EV426DRAFT_342567 [Tirmania nivea]
MLHVLDTLDELLSGADQRLMEKEAKPKGPRALAGTLEPLKKGTMEAVTGEYGDMFGDMQIRNPLPESLQAKMKEGHTGTNKPEHGKSVKRSFRLPAWKAMMDEDTPPGSPFTRSLFSDGHVEGEPVMELVPDHLVTNDEEVKAKAEPLEPQLTSTAAVKAMFEKFLGPSKTGETATTVITATTAATTTTASGEGKVQLSFQDKVTMEKGGHLVPPRISRRRQQKRGEDVAHEAQAMVVVESQPTQSKSRLHVNVLHSRSACINKHLQKLEPEGAPLAEDTKNLYPSLGRLHHQWQLSKKQTMTLRITTTTSSTTESRPSPTSRLPHSLRAPILLSARQGPGLTPLAS